MLWGNAEHLVQTVAHGPQLGREPVRRGHDGVEDHLRDLWEVLLVVLQHLPSLHPGGVHLVGHTLHSVDHVLQAHNMIK